MTRGSLAESVLGITDPSNLQQSLYQAHLTLTGEPFNPYHPAFNSPDDPASRKEWLASLPREYRDRHEDIGSVAKMVIPGMEVTAATTLTDWPLYQGMMRQFGTRADSRANALMIGSLTPLSSRSFQCLAEDEYGADTAIVVDPEGGPDKARHGHFLHGSGLDLPLADASMDFVHTNQLLHMLVDPTDVHKSQRMRTRRLVGEIARVLAPGGQVFMKEAVPDAIDLKGSAVYLRPERVQAAASYLASSLRRHGIGYVKTGPVTDMIGNDFLFDRSRDFSGYAVSTNVAAFVLYAQKRPRMANVIL